MIFTTESPAEQTVVLSFFDEEDGDVLLKATVDGNHQHLGRFSDGALYLFTVPEVWAKRVGIQLDRGCLRVVQP